MIVSEILNIINASTGVSIDTRTIKHGNVFFAIKGENFDGNNYVKAALDKGAVAAIASDEKYSDLQNVILVDDVLLMLQHVAKLHRSKFDIPVIAVTGTNGKTTTKELLCTVLSSKFNPLCTKGNFNNHIGVPLTLLKLTDENDIAVIEIGASGVGEIEFLSKILAPTYGLITSIGKAHILGFGSVENIIKTKLELYNYLRDNDGVFFYKKSIKELSDFITPTKNIIEFSENDMNGKSLESLKLKEIFPFLTIMYKSIAGDIVTEKTNLYGEYNFDNITLAAKVGDYFGIAFESIAKSIGSYVPENNRSQLLAWQGSDVILDAYNANPSSMMSALKSFINISSTKSKSLVLGDMLELGTISEDEHNLVYHFILDNIDAFDKIVFIGKEFNRINEKNKQSFDSISFFEETKDAKHFISNNLFPTNSLILAKGSRGIKVESIFLDT